MLQLLWQLWISCVWDFSFKHFLNDRKKYKQQRRTHLRNFPWLTSNNLWVLKVGLGQRSPNFLDAGPTSRSYQRPRAGLLCILKKATRGLSLTFVYRYCYLFYLLRNIFVMWLMKLILLLHNSCSIWCHAWCCNKASDVHLKFCFKTWIYNI